MGKTLALPLLLLHGSHQLEPYSRRLITKFVLSEKKKKNERAQKGIELGSGTLNYC
jgi:hypothetical protein